MPEHVLLPPSLGRPPPYAILSHRWGRSWDEVNFQQVSLANHKDFEHTPGYEKLLGLSDFAVSVGLKYIWADTCCIDRTDYSAHSAALASMFKWYRDAQVCCVYLSDVEDNDPTPQNSQFRRSQWFTRGWTLQELIAPRQVVFFNRDWEEIGTKASLIDIITEITNIPSTVILMNHPGEMSIAQRMSWAAGRTTSRVEDQAYSLMGLLGVSIPMLYGEGEKAFERLQLEIMKTSDDQSIFAWTRDGDSSPSGLLARSPHDFRDSHNIRQVTDTNTDPARYEMTNKGLRISLHLESHPPPNNNTWATLNCRRGDNGPLLGIQLRRDDSPRTYTRVGLDQLEPRNNPVQPVTEVYIRGKVASRFEISDWMRVEAPYLFVVRNMVAPDAPIGQGNCNAVDWSSDEGLWLTLQRSGHSGVLAFQEDKGKSRLEICIGMHNYSPWCGILENPTQHFQNFWTADGIRDERWHNRDRQIFTTGADKRVSVALTRGLLTTRDGTERACWYVDIRFTPEDSYTLTELGKGCCY